MNFRKPGQTVCTAALVLTIAVAGCKSNPKPAEGPKAPVQGTLNPDGTFTPAPQPPQQGTLNPDGSFTPNAVQNNQPPTQPAAPSSASWPTNAGSAAGNIPNYRTIPAGTRVAVTLSQTLSASRNEVGDGFSGVLAQGIAVGGQQLLARGTGVQGTVVAAKGKGRFKGAGAIGIELTSIAGERVSTSEYERASKGRGRRTAGFIGGGAGLGALIGGIAGGGKGAAIGALAGGGGGTAAAAYTGNRDVVIPAETTVTFRLNSALQVR